MAEKMIIYYHPHFGDSTFYFRSEQEAIDFASDFQEQQREFELLNYPDLRMCELKESLTVVFD